MKQYHIISTPEGKMLKPINVPYPNEDDYNDETGHEPSGAFAIADAVIYKQRCEPLPYIGTREPGTVVSEGEIKEITQCKLGGEWRLLVEGSEFAHYWELETRTAYTDAIPNDYPGIDYQPLFNHMSKQHGLTLTTSEMDEIIGLTTYILAKK